MKKILRLQCCGVALSIMKIVSVQTFLAFLLASIAYAHDIRSQGILDMKISVEFKDTSLKKALSKIEQVAGVKFAYSPSIIKGNQKVSVDASNQKLAELLDGLLTPIDISYKVIADRISLYKASNTKSTSENHSAYAQSLLLTIKGTVTDENSQSLPGVNVIEKGTTNGTTTDVEGKFSLNVQNEKSVLVFSFIGYTSQEVVVSARSVIDVSLVPDLQRLEEVVVVGYGTQKKINLTSAVSSVNNEDIVTTKNENVQNMLTGKISGVRVTQKTAEPGAFNNNFDIRAMGSPLIIIDGIPRSIDVFQRLDPNDIDNVSVLKDASAAIYGVRAANGVVLVTTKKGISNKLELNYSGSFTWQIPSGLPATVDAIEYMTLRNERAMHNVNGGISDLQRTAI